MRFSTAPALSGEPEKADWLLSTQLQCCSLLFLFCPQNTSFMKQRGAKGRTNNPCSGNDWCGWKELQNSKPSPPHCCHQQGTGNGAVPCGCSLSHVVSPLPVFTQAAAPRPTPSSVCTWKVMRDTVLLQTPPCAGDILAHFSVVCIKQNIF